MSGPRPSRTTAPAAASVAADRQRQARADRATERPAGMPASAKTSGCGQERQAGLERGQAADVLEVQGEQEELRRRCAKEISRPAVVEVENAREREEPERQHGRAAAALDRDEREPAARRGAEGAERPRGEPQPSERLSMSAKVSDASATIAVSLAREVEPAGRCARRLADAAPSSERDDDGEGEVDGEDRGASRRRRSAGRRARGRPRTPRRRDRRPDPDGARAGRIGSG